MGIWIENLKEQWGKLTLIGKLTLFPLLVMATLFICWIQLLFDGMDNAAALLKKITIWIFFKK